MTSVRGERTVYRETDVEREYDPPRSSYTTIKRYKVPESITRSVYDNDDTTTKDKVIIRRSERRDSSPSPARSTRTHKSHRSHQNHDHDDYNTEYKVTEKFTERERSRAPSSQSHRDDIDIRLTRTEREPDPSPRRDIRYRVVHRDYSPERPRSEYRVVERDIEVIRAPSPPLAERTETRQWRFERDRSFSPPRERERPYEIERYSKSTEYFQPQPIIIRESVSAAPIIIREERREPQTIIIRREEPQYEFIEKRDTEETKEETKSLVKKEEPPSPTPVPAPETKPEEDYFYERRIVERRRRSDSYDRKTEIRPKDSASQYSSDDSYEYVRREKFTDDGEDKRHHRRHLAEGAIAGIGAAEILRGHRKKQGGSVGGRGRNAIAGAALGAVGSEAISRVRSMRSLRRGSRSRSRSDDGENRRRRHRKHRSRSRSRSRSKSMSRAQQLAIGAGVAGVAALAGYALKNRGNKETIIVNDRPRRSRSRRRRHSVDTYMTDEERQHRDPGHRNRRIAQAGLASAAAAGIWEKVRSRSRGGRDRSKSRIRTGVPIAAAGLGGAALAGLYERNQSNKQAKKDAIIEDEINRGRRGSRSRSRSRSAPAPYGDDRRRSVDGRPGLIAYGHDPIYPESHHSQYSDEEPGRYRRRGGSSSSSPDHRRRRSRSRRRNLAEAGAAAGVAAVAAHEIGKRRERSRSSRERRREYQPPRVSTASDTDNAGPEDDYYDERRPDDPYGPPPMGNPYPPYQNNDPYAQQAYPGSHYFPPPPNGDTAGYVEPQPAYAHAQYNPADYAGQPAAQAPYDPQQPYGGYAEPYPDESHHHNYARDAQYGDDGRRGRDPENVSAPTPVHDEDPTPREAQESGTSTS